MKRTDFLKILGMNGATLMLGASLNNSDLWGYELKEIPIYNNYVRGLHYRKEALAEVEISRDKEIDLERESDNIHDSFAVKVIINDRHIGYIPAYENVALANLMDHGVQLRARISKHLEGNHQQVSANAIAIRITAQMMVPISQLEMKKLTKLPSDDASDLYRQNL